MSNSPCDGKSVGRKARQKVNHVTNRTFVRTVGIESFLVFLSWGHFPCSLPFIKESKPKTTITPSFSNTLFKLRIPVAFMTDVAAVVAAAVSSRGIGAGGDLVRLFDKVMQGREARG